MKHLFSLLIAPAATASLLLALPGMARADNDAVTSIPDPSGAASCYGKNPDGSPAAWTIGGEIRYLSDVSNPTTDYPNGWHNIKQIANAYPNRGGCEYQMTTSSNLKPGCAAITGDMVIYYTAHGSTGPAASKIVGSYNITAPDPNGLYTKPAPIGFAELDNVGSVQYKVTSYQNGVELGREATTYP